MSNLKGKLLFPFIAPPNGGKGTQTVALSSHFNIPKVDMGGLLREVAKEDTPLALQIREMQSRGQLVTLDIVMAVLEQGLLKTLRDNPAVIHAFILDGFPRSLEQAERLILLCEQEGAVLSKVFYLDVPDAVITGRAVNRRFCPQCDAIYNLLSKPPKAGNLCDLDGATLFQRNDDLPDKVTVRLESFAKETMPLIDLFRNKGLLVTIDGNRSVDVIQADLIREMTPLLSAPPSVI